MNTRPATELAFRRGGICNRLIVWGLGLFGVALGIATVAGTVYTRHQIEQSAAALQSEIAALTARHIQSYLARKIERLDDAASIMATHPPGREEQRLLAHLFLKKDRSIKELSVIDDSGRERVKISDWKTYLKSDLTDQGYSAPYQSAMQGRPYVSPVYISDRAEPYLILAVPMQAAPHQISGVLVARTNLKFLWDVVREKRFGRAGYVYLVNEMGDLIAHEDSSLVLKRHNLMGLPKVELFLSTRSPDQSPGKRGPGIHGDEVLSTYALVPDLGWGVIVEEPTASAMAELEQLEWFSKTFLAIGLLLGAIVIVALSRRITRPILELRESAEIIGNGNFNHRVNINTGDEIDELGAKFNQMAEALKTSYETLEDKVLQRTQEISALYEVTTMVNQSLVLDTVLSDVIKKITERFHFDTTRIFLFDDRFDKVALRAYYNAANAPGIDVGPFRKGQSVVGRVAESGEPAIFRDIQTDSRYIAWSESKISGEAGFHFFAALPIKTQTTVFGTAAFSGKEMRDLNDDELRLLNAMCEHVAVAVEKASLFEEASRRSAELAEALRVKSEFVAGISHELRTPLNVIMGYAKMTEEGILGEINAEQKDAQQKIGRHAEVLLKMVNDVLSLSRVEAKTLSLETGTVYIEELMCQIQGQAEQLRRNKPLEFGWYVDHTIPPLVTDPLKLEEILQNLIGNAIKFTPAGRIEVRVRNLLQQNKVEFSVSDSGIGIEDEELERIFNAFEQGKEAHTGNLDGVGLGLSIVKRYLGLMRGDIHVTSRVGQGSTFTFTIPYTLDTTIKAA